MNDCLNADKNSNCEKPSGFVGAQHEFHDQAYIEDWATRFMPTPDRLNLFNTMIERLSCNSLPHRHIVELGTGPGYLAEHILARIPDITYECVDFSQPMLGIAEKRLSQYRNRLRLTQADLLSSDWTAKLMHPVGAFVSTWALHDLGGQAETAKVYRDCYEVLAVGGVLLNGDFVKPDDTEFEYEPGRFPVSRHLELLESAGFRSRQMLIFLEHELLNPTSAQNYACMEGIA